ncbi:hypothetical protein Tco_1367762 [Tanacetum coccineum]
MPNPKDISDPTTAINIELVLMAKAFKLNYSTPTNNNQRISFKRNALAIGKLHNWIANQNRNGNVAAAWAKGNGNGNNGIRIMCLQHRGLGLFCTVRPRRKDVVVAFDLLRDALSAIVGLSELKGSPRADYHDSQSHLQSRGPILWSRSSAPPSPDHVPGPEEPGHAPPSPDYVTIRSMMMTISLLRTRPDDEMDLKIDEGSTYLLLPVVVALPATAPFAEEIEPFETDESAATPPPHPAYRMTARISIPEPFTVPHIPVPLSPSPPSHSIDSTTSSPITIIGQSSCYITYDRLRLQLLPIHYHYHHPSYSPPPDQMHHHPCPHQLLLHSTTSYYILQTGVNLQTTSDGVSLALGPQYEVRRDPERYVGYGITDSWDEIVETLQGAPVSTDTELGAHMREFESLVRRDTDEIYTRLDDEQGQRQLLAGRVNMLFRDRRTHAHTRQLMETEAGMSREAWGRAMDASDLAHGGVISLRTTVHAQMAEIAELQSADRRRQRAMSDLLETDRRRREEMRELRAADRTRQQQIIQTLTAVQTLQRETIPLQGLVTTLQEQVTALQGQVMTLQGQVTALQGQQGPTGGPALPELPEDAGSSS